MLTKEEEDLIIGLTWRYGTKYSGEYQDLPGIDSVIYAMRIHNDEARQLLAIIEKLKKELEDAKS